MFSKSTACFTLALTFFNFFTLKHGKFRFPRWNCCYILYTQIWEDKNKLVRFCLHLDLPLLLVYIAAFIWQTQWIIASEMVWLTLQKNPKCCNVFDNAGRMFFQNSCNLVVIVLQLSLVFFCKRASAKLKRFLIIYIIYIPEILIICKRFVAFTFDLCDLLCFVCNSWIAKRIEIILWPLIAPDQILHRFYVINMAFLSLRRRHLSHETSLSSRSEERSLYSSTCYNKHLFQFLDLPYY